MLYEVLRTTGPAFASFREADLGTIEPVILRIAYIIRSYTSDILKAEPVMTVIGGEVVWRR